MWRVIPRTLPRVLHNGSRLGHLSAGGILRSCVKAEAMCSTIHTTHSGNFEISNHLADLSLSSATSTAPYKPRFYSTSTAPTSYIVSQLGDISQLPLPIGIEVRLVGPRPNLHPNEKPEPIPPNTLATVISPLNGKGYAKVVCHVNNGRVVRDGEEEVVAYWHSKHWRLTPHALEDSRITEVWFDCLFFLFELFFLFCFL